MPNLVGIDLNISDETIKKAIHDTIIASVTTALDNKDGIIKELVGSFLTQKVNKDGKVSGNSYDDKIPILDYLLQKSLGEILKEEINAEILSRKDEVRKLIRKEIIKTTNVSQFTEAFFKNISEAIDSSWVPRIQMNFGKLQDR